MNQLTDPQTLIKRDRYGRPLIIPANGGKARAFTRATTVAGSLDDLYGLMGWAKRQTAIGLADRPDLQLAVTTHRDDKKQMDRICEQAMQASGSDAAATTGTALHKLTELVDTGQELPTVPADVQADLDAYRQATADLEIVAMEQMVVLDDLEVAGTPDRIVNFRGTNYVADLKTGKSVEYGQTKIAMQLALYAHGRTYNPADGTRTPLPDVDLDRAIVIHVPAGTGTAQVAWIDIAAGWEMVPVALQVRAWRKRRDLLAVIKPDPVAVAISQAGTVTDLEAIWQANQACWTDEHTRLASARKEHIVAASAAA